MYHKSAILLLSFLVGLAGPARADYLILKDGRHFSGQCTKNEDTIIYVADDGETSEYKKDECKRCAQESILSDSGMHKMFDDLAAIVTSVLDEPEPSPRQFLDEWNSFAQ